MSVYKAVTANSAIAGMHFLPYGLHLHNMNSLCSWQSSSWQLLICSDTGLLCAFCGVIAMMSDN